MKNDGEERWKRNYDKLDFSHNHSINNYYIKIITFKISYLFE